MSKVFVRAPESTVLTDPDGYQIDVANPLPVNPAESGAASIGYNQITVSSSSATRSLDIWRYTIDGGNSHLCNFWNNWLGHRRSFPREAVEVVDY